MINLNVKGIMMKFLFLTMSLIFSSTLFAQVKAEKEKASATELTLELAQQYVAKAIACAQKNKWKISVAVVNSEGNLLAFGRDDGAYVGSIQAAMDKAISSNAFQRPTKAFADSIKDGRIGLLSVQKVVGIEGGLPILLNNKHSGGIGVSGAKSVEDEQCAKVAME